MANYQTKLNLLETEIAIKFIKDNFERDFSEALNLIRVSAPLMVVPESGLNDNLNGFERPVHFDVLYLKKNEISITTGYEDWVRVAFAIAGTFHPVYGRRLFMRLCELDGILHDEVKSEKLIFSAYMNRSGNCDFGTILFLASKKGFIH